METVSKKKYDEYLSVNEAGHLEIVGFDTEELARQYGTPLFVVSEHAIVDNYRKLFNAFESRNVPFILGFGTKANHGLAVCKLLQNLGAYFDVVGEGEIAIALKLGVHPSRIILNGNCKTKGELETAVRMGFGFINIDNLDEVAELNQIASDFGTKARVLVRVKPSYSFTAQWEPQILEERRNHTKFGIDIPSGAALEACRRVQGSSHLHFAGLHVHMGWVEDLDDAPVSHLKRFGDTADEVLGFASEVKSKLGAEVEFLDFGGGLNVARPEGYGPIKTRTAPTPDEFAECYVSRVKSWAKRENVDRVPTLVFETGRYLVQNAGILLGRIHSVKEDPTGIYANTDASTNLLLNRLTGKFYYHTILANKASRNATVKVNVVGPICGSYDMIARGVSLPPVQAGDLIAVFDAGAYCESKASHFNAYPLPATVLVGKNNSEIVRRRESLDDLFTQDVIPDRLNHN
jgi:diaminopimelate decarboxylase